MGWRGEACDDQAIRRLIVQIFCAVIGWSHARLCRYVELPYLTITITILSGTTLYSTLGYSDYISAAKVDRAGPERATLENLSNGPVHFTTSGL